LASLSISCRIPSFKACKYVFVAMDLSSYRAGVRFTRRPPGDNGYAAVQA